MQTRTIMQDQQKTKVIQFSPGRTGSTLVWQILEQLGFDVIKTHTHSLENVPVVTTYRDPRDVFCSFYRISHNIPNESEMRADLRFPGFRRGISRKLGAIRYVRSNFSELAIQLKSGIATCYLRYESFIENHDYIFEELENFFGCKISGEIREKIHEGTNIKANKARSEKFNTFSDYDPNTHIHGRHVGSGKAGQWQQVCPSWLRLYLNHALRREIQLYRRLCSMPPAHLKT